MSTAAMLAPPEDTSGTVGASEAAKAMADDLSELRTSFYYLPASRDPFSTRDKFAFFADRWESDTAILSSISEKSMHPAYQRIVGMGMEVVPYILRRLETQPYHWFWALTAITGADPVSPEDRGDIESMARAWITWGRENGLL